MVAQVQVELQVLQEHLVLQELVEQVVHQGLVVQMVVQVLQELQELQELVEQVVHQGLVV